MTKGDNSHTILHYTMHSHRWRQLKGGFYRKAKLTKCVCLCVHQKFMMAAIRNMVLT